jgi:aspartate aminotransferase
MRLSKRVSLISPSPTLGISAKAAELRKKGVDVVDLGAGQPDFDTPENIKLKAKAAIDRGFTKYTPTSGIKELKEAICQKLERENGLRYSPEEIVVSCGAKHSLFNILFALLDEREEVLVPSPYWVSYPEMIRLAGGRPVFLETSGEGGFKVTAEQLRKAITSRTKAFILNSPSNPTGAVYSRQELEELAEVLRDKGVYCISDEVYEKFVYEGEHVSIASLPGMKELTVVVNAVSKTYSMTGWRIGYLAAPKELASAVSNIQDHTTSNPTSISQHAALEALTGSQESVRRMVETFRERRDFVVRRLNAMGIRCRPPPGAFYVFPRVSQFFGGEVRDSVAFCEKLLEREGVATVPGTAFGSDEHIRISYAASLESLEKGMDRLERFLTAFNPPGQF